MDIDKNQKSRLWYVRYWVQYMKKMPSEVWSKQQNILINSALENAKQFHFSPEFYLKTKNESDKFKRKEYKS